ncbi:minor capsid protein [Paraclostridium bifermentans]|uniref:minor capsid protein n=1 Tax=Paraclostridium bifermentans TaxID=1490 RepID=UPI002430B2DA|nr:minor capsid protein [Paraclostridium bifermentans]
MDYSVLIALWELYKKADKKQLKLLIYTFVLLHLMKKNKRISDHFYFYTKEEAREQREYQAYKVKRLLNKQYSKLEELIEDSVIESYYSAYRILQKELSIEGSLDYNEVKNLVNETWVGSKNFKQRLAWNLGEIYSKYQELLEKGADMWEFEKLQKNYYYRLRRLLDTETHRDINQACLKIYREKKIQFVKWIAHQDERTCPVCLAYDQRIFPIQDAPFCPDHPFCRCLIIPSSKEEYVRWISQNMDLQKTK